MKNIVDVIIDETREHLNSIAVIDAKESLSYLHLFRAVDRMSQELMRLGLSRFNRVALLCQDSIEYIVISLAVLKIQAVIVPIPFGAVSDEVDELLDKIKVNFIIFQKGAYRKNKAIPISKRCGLKKDISLALLNNEESLPVDFYKMNPAFIRFTSGTTGASKGVVLGHESIIERTSAANKGLKINKEDRIIWVLSMSFHFVVTILLFLRKGATVILCSRDFPISLLEALQSHKATFIYASPVHYNMINSLGSFRRVMFSKVRLAVSTSVRLPEDIAREFRKKFGFELAQAYGIIEAGLPALNTSPDPAKRLSVGRILPDYSCKIINKDNSGLGNIYIKGKGLFDAYFSPWKKRTDILKKGWFDTGDVGKIDKDGFLFILGRRKNVINFSGMKIFPGEVESLLNRHPNVRESLVYGQENPRYGQLPLAKIVLKDKAKKGFDPEELRRFCYKHLASYKVPKEFEVVEKLPKTLSGKIKVFKKLKTLDAHIKKTYN